MLGKSTARLESSGERWIYRVWGCPDIHTRQKWQAIWPRLAGLGDTTSLLDAGCGTGRWSLEIAARRPTWTILGVDRDAAAIGRARTDAARLGCRNVTFLVDEFLQFKPATRFDVVLSVASAHYLAEAGLGEELFVCFRKWLRNDGRLVLLGPRCRQEVPLTRNLPALPAHDVFGRADLERLCHSAALDCESIQPLIGAWGTAAKQLAAWSATRLGRAGAYPLEVLLDAADRLRNGKERTSAAWLMVARRRSNAGSELRPPA